MKQLFCISAFLLTLCISLSCTKEEPAFLTVDTTVVKFSNEGGSETIEFSTNKDWTAETDVTWLSVTKSGTSSSTLLKLTAEPNPEFNSRNAIVLIKVDDLEELINITQSKNQEVLIISKNSFDVSEEEHIIEVELETNLEVECIIDESCKSWISPAETKDISIKTINFNIARNDSYGDRQGTIIIKQKGGNLSETVTVNQVQNDAIIISEKNHNLSEEEQTLEIEVKANTDFEYTIDQACKSWISAVDTKGLSTNRIHFNIARNDSYDSREGKITFKQAGGSITETVTIIQGQKNAIIIADENINFEAKGDSYTINVESNIPYDVTISDEAKSWLSIMQGTKALISSDITIAASENTTYTARSGLIVVSGEDIRKEIFVRQEAGHISVNQTEFQIGTEGGEIRFEVSHNISYKAEISGDAKSWVTYNASKSSETELWYTVSENKDTDSRTGVISIKNGDFDIPVTIIQAQKDVIIVNKDKVEVPLAGGTFSVDISTNINVSVEIEESAKGWISQVETKAMQESTLNFSITYNDLMTSREGQIIISGNGIRMTIDVNQAGPILVTGISLDKKSMELFEGGSRTLNATITPTDATYKDVEWVSSNPAVATVGDGRVMAITRGTATITANCGGYSASCEVTVLGEEDLELTEDVYMRLTGTSLTIMNNRYYYGRTFTIYNNSPVDVKLTEIGTTNFIDVERTLAAGSSTSIELYFNYNVYPKVTLRFKYNNKDYEVYLENY